MEIRKCPPLILTRMRDCHNMNLFDIIKYAVIDAENYKM